MLFDDGRLTEIFPARVSLPLPEPQPASIGTPRPEDRRSGREQSDDYFRVASVLNDRWRVIVCKDAIQWILQQRRRDTPKWDGASYCTTRQGLLRCIREKVKGDIDPSALAALEALPETILTFSPYPNITQPPDKRCSMNIYKQDEVGRFLRYLDPEADSFVFQTVSDRKATGGRTIAGRLPDVSQELANANESGFGISVTVNDTDGASRKAEDVTRIRAVWHEDDTGKTLQNVRFPLRPSLTIQSSPGKYHHYWLVEGGWSADDEGREDFRRVMASMGRDYDSDRNAADISRALRLPGTLHRKGDPHPVSVVWDNGGSPCRYSRKEIVSAFAGAADSRIDDTPNAAPRAAPGQVDLDTLRDALAFIPSDDRDKWLKVGMAIHLASGGSDDAFGTWDDWSRGSKKYDAQRAAYEWKTFRHDHGDPVTIGSIFHLAKQNGWRGQTNDASLPEENISIERHPGDLAERTIEAVKRFFADGNKSNPSPDHYAGMEEIAKVIQAMAEGDASLGRDFLISSLPTGIGKTTTIREAIREIVRRSEYDDVGTVVFLSRVEEIEKLIAGMGLEETEFATIVSQSYEDKVPLGNLQPDRARVLFTTQQMLTAYLKGKDCFADIDVFHFGGKPRQVRIWDEAILPTSSLTLGQWDITSLFRGLLLGGHRELVEELENLFDTVKGTDDKAVFDMPDISRFKVGMDEARSLFKDDSDRKAIEALWKLSGRTVRIRRDGKGNVALDYEDVFPDDLGPLLVCDASGHLRQTYRFWHDDRKGVRFLHSPGKRYSGLTIHHWNCGSGKDQFQRRNKGRWEIYDGIVATIRSIPKEENVLIIHFKRDARTADIERELREQLPWDGRLRFCTWGKHTATNEFADCKHVILASVLQYGTPHYEALARGAKKLRTEDDLDQSDYTKTRLGEIKHNLFQAACRGAVRKAESDSCPPDCHLYVIYSTKSLPRDILTGVFPEAKVEDWRPVYNLKGRKQKLAGYLQRKATIEGGLVKKADLTAHLGITKTQLSRVLDSEVIDYLKDVKGVEVDIKRLCVILSIQNPNGDLLPWDEGYVSTAKTKTPYERSSRLFIKGIYIEKHELQLSLSSDTLSRSPELRDEQDGS